MGFETVWGIGTAILSIVLTGVAWRKGWGPRAVLPIIIATVLDLGVGAVLGESTPTAIVVGAVVDVVAAGYPGADGPPAATARDADVRLTRPGYPAYK